MAHVLRLVDAASDATIYFDWYSPSGTNNPNSLVTKVRSLDLGSDRPEADIFSPEVIGDSRLIRYDLPPVQVQVVMYCAATTWDNLNAALTTLRGYLLDPTNKRILWQPDTAAEKRYADIIIGDVPSIVRGQGPEQEYAAFVDKKVAEITVTMVRKWGLRGPAVTTTVTVPNDPADTNGRVIQVSNAGNAPTPAALKVQGDTGAKIRAYTVGRRAAMGYPSSRITDYAGATNPTRFAQLNASANGWSQSFGNAETTSASDGNASGGNTARIAATDALAKKRSRVQRTANLESLRGDWDVWMRVNVTTTNAIWYPQLRWGPSLADPPAYAEPEAEPIDTTGITTFGYVDWYLGTVSIPMVHALGGVAFEVHARRASGAGNMDADFIFFLPAGARDHQAKVFVPGGSTDVWNYTQFLGGGTGSFQPSGLTDGTVGSGVYILNTVGNALGTPPVAGLSWPSGRHQVSFKPGGFPLIQSVGPTITGVFRVRNITDNNDAVTTSVVLTNDSIVTPITVEFDSPGGKFYEPQVWLSARSGGSAASIQVGSIEHEFLPAILSGEEGHTDPETRLVHKMDASDNILGPLLAEGELPIWLLPGDQFIGLFYEDLPVVSGAPAGQSILTRDCPVSVIRSPRYLT